MAHSKTHAQGSTRHRTRRMRAAPLVLGLVATCAAATQPNIIVFLAGSSRPFHPCLVSLTLSHFSPVNAGILQLPNTVGRSFAVVCIESDPQPMSPSPHHSPCLASHLLSSYFSRTFPHPCPTSHDALVVVCNHGRELHPPTFPPCAPQHMHNPHTAAQP